MSEGQPAMRERVFSLRERRFLHRHRPTWAMAAAGAVLLTGVGAFDTGETATWTAFAYFGTLMAAAAALSAVILDSWGEPKFQPSSLARRAVATGSAVALVMTPLVWLMSALALDGSWEPARMTGLFGQTFLVSAIFVIVQLAIYVQVVRRPAPSLVEASAPTVLRRLPERLRGAELLAVQAEDHYLRFHTDRGSALLLMNLGDAASQLAGLDGAQTHRSWWVARPAVLSATRGGGRASLKLKAGLVAPVSRTYAPRLRRAGWF